jgi:hypothetical protein
VRTAAYRKIEKAIAASDSGSIFERWRYGRLLLVDAQATTAGGSFKNGVLAQLIAKTGLSEREIQRRKQCGLTYETEGQFRHAVAEFETWHDLAAANFPESPKLEGERPYDPRTTADLKRDHERHSGLPTEFEQRSLFEYFDDKPDATLLDAERHADELTELAARMSVRCEERHVYLDELVKAVDGDKTRLLREAQEILDERDDDDADS